MGNVADYLISAVRYDFEHTHIIKVKRHLDQGEHVARGNIINRNIVADDLSKGLKYKTIHRSEDNKWVVLEELKINPNTGFITTDSNSTRDSLGRIPEF